MTVQVVLSCGDAKAVDWNIAMHLRIGDPGQCAIHGRVTITYISKPTR